MFGFLKFLSPRAWLEVGLAVLAAIILYKVYTAGENHIRTANDKVVHAQEVANAQAELTVQQRIAAALTAYKTTLAAPPPAPTVPQPHLVCRAAGGGAVPGGGGAVSGGNGAGVTAAVGAGQAPEGFDPAPAVDADGAAVDAEFKRLVAKVTLLQDTIRAYQAGGMVAK